MTPSPRAIYSSAPASSASPRDRRARRPGDERDVGVVSFDVPLEREGLRDCPHGVEFVGQHPGFVAEGLSQGRLRPSCGPRLPGAALQHHVATGQDGLDVGEPGLGQRRGDVGHLQVHSADVDAAQEGRVAGIACCLAAVMVSPRKPDRLCRHTDVRFGVWDASSASTTSCWP